MDLGTGSSDNDRSFSPVNVLRANGYLDELHLLILTHPHEDHLSDIHSLRGIPIRSIVAPSVPASLLNSSSVLDRSTIDEYTKLVDSFAHPMPFGLESGAKIDWDETTITPFFPNSQSSNLNDYSMVVLFEYSGSKLLLTGDNEETSWKTLLEDERFVRAARGTDVFVAPHHGRSSGFYRPLFDVIHPKLTIISDGPSQETSATEQYSAVTSGWKVRAGRSSEKRKCVTTRHDGSILVEFPDTILLNNFHVTVEKVSAPAQIRRTLL